MDIERDQEESGDLEYANDLVGTNNDVSNGDGDGVDSDAASVALEDVEGSSDDDIFQEKNLSREQLIEKLKQMIRKGKQKGLEPAHGQSDLPQVNEPEGWYSDPGEEDELLRMSDSDDETHSHPFYKDGENMKKFEMIKCIKFMNAKEYQEVLRDWSVKKGYELVYIKNESTRITAKCVNERCTWRIRASLIMGGPDFQVKTIKG